MSPFPFCLSAARNLSSFQLLPASLITDLLQLFFGLPLEFRHATRKCLFNLLLIFPENGYVTEEIKHSISVLRLDLFMTIPTSHKGKVWVSCACYEVMWGWRYIFTQS